jgi:hypothetical protein
VTTLTDAAMPTRGSTKHNPYSKAIEENAHRKDPDSAKKAGPFSTEDRPSELDKQRSLIYQAARLVGYRVKTVVQEHDNGTGTIFFQVRHDEHGHPVHTSPDTTDEDGTATPKRSRARD